MTQEGEIGMNSSAPGDSRGRGFSLHHVIDIRLNLLIRGHWTIGQNAAISDSMQPQCAFKYTRCEIDMDQIFAFASIILQNYCESCDIADHLIIAKLCHGFARPFDSNCFGSAMAIGKILCGSISAVKSRLGRPPIPVRTESHLRETDSISGKNDLGSLLPHPC
jgi:hypothetical protein